MRLIVIFSLIGLITCSDSSEKRKTLPYVIQPMPKPEFMNGILTIASYYGRHNFILDTSDRIFYYKVKGNGWYCTSNEEGLGLTESDYIEIPVNDLPRVLLTEISDTLQHVIVISSPADTINSHALAMFLYHFKKTGRKCYTIRKINKEEREVLNTKRRLEYN